MQRIHTWPSSKSAIELNVHAFNRANRYRKLGYETVAEDSQSLIRQPSVNKLSFPPPKQSRLGGGKRLTLFDTPIVG